LSCISREHLVCEGLTQVLQLRLVATNLPDIIRELINSIYSCHPFLPTHQTYFLGYRGSQPSIDDNPDLLEDNHQSPTWSMAINTRAVVTAKCKPLQPTRSLHITECSGYELVRYCSVLHMSEHM